MNKKKSLLKRFKNELKFYQALLNDTRVPKVSKVLLGVAVAYVVTPFDIIPDFIPVLGQLDDLIIVPTLIFIAVRFIPRTVWQENRQKFDL